MIAPREHIGEYLTLYLQGGIIVQGSVLPGSTGDVVMLEDAIAVYDVRVSAIMAISRARTGDTVEKLYTPPEHDNLSH